ncbi:hypothetical protein TIFTF001_017617 [Ficus carica]|uniref:Uncharacterized protein n=1 Tax=Ficus carica TaxID=3494 RepID=A0AA88AUL9_FICCA|nr:hypothetical protein TIFTF001_017617 [Ficus carica]
MDSLRRSPSNSQQHATTAKPYLMKTAPLSSFTDDDDGDDAPDNISRSLRRFARQRCPSPDLDGSPQIRSSKITLISDTRYDPVPPGALGDDCIISGNVVMASEREDVIFPAAEEAPPSKQFPKDHSHQLEEDLTCHLINQHPDEIASYSTTTQEDITGLQSSAFQDSQDPHAFSYLSTSQEPNSDTWKS